MTNSKTQHLSLQDWARRVRRRMLRDLLRAAAAQARAMAKKSRRPRRGPAAAERGFLAQHLAADYTRMREMLRQMAELAMEPSDTAGVTARRRRRARRRPLVRPGHPARPGGALA